MRTRAPRTAEARCRPHTPGTPHQCGSQTRATAGPGSGSHAAPPAGRTQAVPNKKVHGRTSGICSPTTRMRGMAHLSTHTHTHARKHTHTRTHAHTHTHTHARTHARTHTHKKKKHAHARTLAHARSHTHACTHRLVCRAGGQDVGVERVEGEAVDLSHVRFGRHHGACAGGLAGHGGFLSKPCSQGTWAAWGWAGVGAVLRPAGLGEPLASMLACRAAPLTLLGG